ncbi:MAG: hypothetical protein CVT95_13295 [Bacteroidetes bacterium HGW-Bacteroidetes-12]|nr:MAG: hypothetical protein CVT95_13295 [Bacteroidetes bacterium HGW-Bacteroidetes-12]
MKKIILSVVAVVAMALTSPSADGQNNVWSLPPNYYKFGNITTTPLPAPGGQTIPLFDNYDGLPAQFNHNAMQDKDGNLLFFVVDGI